MRKSFCSTCMVINETGWGNGVLELPFIISIGKRFDRIVHTPTPFLENIGTDFFSSQWHRVEVDWASSDDREFRWFDDSIRRFEINTIINLRNEDVGRDWNRFIKSIKVIESHVSIWDLLDQYTGPDPQIQSRWTAMLGSHGLHPEWHEAYRIIAGLQSSRYNPSDVLICSGASRVDKAVAATIWADVSTLLHRSNPKLRIRLLNGITNHDQICGAEIARILEARGIPFSACCPIAPTELVNELTATSVVAANDSFLMHLSCALHKPTLGLFCVTNKNVWGYSNSDVFLGRTSNSCCICSGVMPTQGVCWSQQACPSTPNLSWEPSRLASDILFLLEQT